MAERTAELGSSTLQLRQSERLRSLALAAGQMGSWEWNLGGSIVWDHGQCEIFGVDPHTFVPPETVQPLINRDDFELIARIPQGHEGREYLPDRISCTAANWRGALVHWNRSSEL